MSDRTQSLSLEADTATDKLHLVLITGMSGAGKSVALRALEDAGYLCVDNLPAELILQFIDTIKKQKKRRNYIAIAIDGRTAESLHLLPQIYTDLQKDEFDVKMIFLNASTSALVKRFSETRRRHPLSQTSHINDNSLHLSLKEAIQQERLLLTDIHELGGAVIDTSLLRPSQLQTWVKESIDAPQNTMTLVFESFAFKRGLPVDADYVFDVRILPNPYYEVELRQFTGRDLVVQQWLKNHPPVINMRTDVTNFLEQWIPAFIANHRSYLTIAIGCTGGQHRSVFLVEELAKHFSKQWNVIARHREFD